MRSEHSASLRMASRLALSLSLFSMHAFGGMNCNAHLSDVEKMICDPDTGLLDLDEQLNASYRATLDVVTDKDDFRREQRLWLQSGRDSCKDWTCVQEAMQTRLVALYSRRIAAQPPLETLLDDKGAHSACGAIAKIAGDGQLGAYVLARDPSIKPSAGDEQSMRAIGNFGDFHEGYAVPLRHGQPAVRYGLFNTGGTCSTFQILPFQKPPAIPHQIAVDVTTDTDNNADMVCGTGEEIVFLARRFYIVGTGGTSGQEPGRVQWLAPDATWHPICEIEHLSTRMIVTEATEPKICTMRANADHGLISPEWQSVELPDALTGTEEAARGTMHTPVFQSAEIADVDLAGHGIVEPIARLLYSYMGGGGGYSTNLLVLSDDHKKASQSVAAKRLRAINLEPEPQIFLSGSRAYVTGSLRGGFPYSGLVSFASDPPKQVCTFSLRATFGIKQEFPLLPDSTR